MAAASIYQLYMKGKKVQKTNTSSFCLFTFCPSLFIFFIPSYPFLTYTKAQHKPVRTHLCHIVFFVFVYLIFPPLRYLSLPACVQHVLLWSVQHTAVSWVWATAPQESRTASQGEDTTNFLAYIQIVRYKELDSHMKVYFSLDKQFATLFFGLFFFYYPC